MTVDTAGSERVAGRHAGDDAAGTTALASRGFFSLLWFRSPPGAGCFGHHDLMPITSTPTDTPHGP